MALYLSCGLFLGFLSDLLSLSLPSSKARRRFSNEGEKEKKGKDGHQWSVAHPNDKLYFWLTVGMAGEREREKKEGKLQILRHESPFSLSLSSSSRSLEI